MVSPEKPSTLRRWWTRAHHLAMPESRHRLTIVPALLSVLLGACSVSKQPSSSSGLPDSQAVHVLAAPGSSDCPATGLWAKCSVLYRLDRAGIAPRLDSTLTVEEQALHANSSFVVRFGANSKVEVFLYADSMARIADGKKLDRSKL